MRRPRLRHLRPPRRHEASGLTLMPRRTVEIDRPWAPGASSMSDETGQDQPFIHLFIFQKEKKKKKKGRTRWNLLGQRKMLEEIAREKQLCRVME